MKRKSCDSCVDGKREKAEKWSGRDRDRKERREKEGKGTKVLSFYRGQEATLSAGTKDRANG